MKKAICPSGIQFSISFIMLLLIVQVSFGQDCKTRAANKPSVSVRFPDSYVGASSGNQKPASWNITKMKPNLAKAESWVKNILSGFTGAKLAYSNDYFLDPLDFADRPEDAGAPSSYAKQFYKATGIKGFYGSKMRFYAYYCYDNNNKIFTEDESGSFIQVNFNNVFASALCTSVGVFTINGKPAFEIYEKSRTEGSIDFYDLRAKYDNHPLYTSYGEIIIFRNSDKPVFIPITRKEYLQQMLKDTETYRSKEKDFKNSFYKNQIKSFEEEMRVYKASDKSYTPEKEAKRRKWFNEDNNPEKLAKDLAKIDADVKSANEIIIQYLKKPQEWLSRNFSHFYPFSTYTGNGLTQYFDGLDVFTESSEDKTRTQIVSLNPAYFNNKLSNDVPQLISVHLAKGRYPHMLKVADLVKQPGALGPLKAILSPGNQ